MLFLEPTLQSFLKFSGIVHFMLAKVPTKPQKLYGPFSWMEFSCQSHYRKVVYFLQLSPRCAWYSFHRPQKNKRQSQPWSQPVVLKLDPGFKNPALSPPGHSVNVNTVKKIFDAKRCILSLIGPRDLHGLFPVSYVRLFVKFWEIIGHHN